MCNALVAEKRFAVCVLSGVMREGDVDLRKNGGGGFGIRFGQSIVTAIHYLRRLAYSMRKMMADKALVRSLYPSETMGSGVSVDFMAYPCIGYGCIGSSGSRDHARIRRIFLDGYGVLVVRIVIFKISSFKLQNARLLLIFTKYSNPVRQYAQSASLSLQSDASTIPADQRPQLLERQSGLHGVNARHVSKANVSDVNQQRRQHQQELQL
ncbi:hypothetical protein Tco_1001018 [Tanacetum coccineum]